ncbi:MAG TPA: hypothetical protein PK752_03205 [Accumulibacter sp.]|jgi:hypothetical protein|uniref:hypothetical protein n=1 Tax=Accumulibacter sp. TaxID=2053492 RepID=UPI002B921C89|nr:hypothetical protein [Accumulibacter sp.]HRD87256.1 hypothetical protein [Accumulibacter sp.]
MSDIKTKYPSTSSVTLTISLASLASGSAGVFTAGQESTAVDNTSNLDVDHLLSGVIRAGTSPTASRYINVYVYANISSASGTPTYPDVLDGTDSAETFTSANVMNGIVKLAASMISDSTSNRDYFFGPVSVAQLFGGSLPKFWGVFVAHDTAVALNATGGQHVLTYERIQAQTV